MSPNSPNVAISVRFIFSIFVFVYFFVAKVVFVFETWVKGGGKFCSGWFRCLPGCCRLYFLSGQKGCPQRLFLRGARAGGRFRTGFAGVVVCCLFSELLYELFHDERHFGLCCGCGFLYFFVGCFLDDAFYSEVCDDGYGEYFDASVPCDDDFGYGGHAYGVASDGVEVFVLGGCLECGPLCAYIYSLLYFDVVVGGYFKGFVDEPFGVGFAHVGEAYSEFFEVLASEGVFGEQVDVVAYDHEVSYGEGGVHASCCVGYEQVLDA